MYGIDLGTTNSIIGFYDEKTGKTNLSEIVPSVVNLKTQTVGKIPKQDMLHLSRDVISAFKTNIVKRYAIAGSYFILKDLKELVEDKNESILISVPAYFNVHQRNATIKAGEMAGWKEVNLINEPTAAILSYGQKNKGLFIVYDLGGGTFDVSITEVNKGYKTLATYGTNIGGEDLDNYLTQQFKRQVILDNVSKGITNDSKELWAQLKLVLNSLKHQIQKTKKDCDFVFLGKKYTLTVEQYRTAVFEVFNETLNMLQYILQNYDKETLNMILVGGSTRDPFLQDLISDFIKHNNYSVNILPINYNQDTLVAQGVAYAAYLHETNQLNLIVDVTKSLGIAVSDSDGNDICSNIIQENTIIPTKASLMVTSIKDSDELVFDLYEGLKQHQLILPTDESLGEIKINVDNPEKEHVYVVTVSVDANGIITFEVLKQGDFVSKKLEIIK